MREGFDGIIERDGTLDQKAGWITGAGNGIKDPTCAKFPSFVTKDWA